MFSFCAYSKAKLVSTDALVKTSSSSQWDSPKPYSGLIDGSSEREFAFHTSSGKKEWVMLDLKKTYNLSEISIVNRKSTAFHNRARNMKVQISQDGKAWNTVYVLKRPRAVYRLKYKVGKNDSKNINDIKARYLRLVIDNNNALHLSKIRVYGE